jgi:hypothetical protein
MPQHDQRKYDERGACNQQQCQPAGEPKPDTKPENQIYKEFEEQ